MKKLSLLLTVLCLLCVAFVPEVSAEDMLFCLTCRKEAASGICPDCGQATTVTMPRAEKDQGYLIIRFDCEKNRIFAKQSVNVYMDNILVGSVNQGESNATVLLADKGIHEIVVETADGDENAVTYVKLQQTTSLSFTAKVHLTKVEIQNVVTDGIVTPAEIAAYERAKYCERCMTADYDHFARYPESLNGTLLNLKGKVVAVGEEKRSGTQAVVKDSQDNLWMVTYTREDHEPRMLVGDQVEVWGAYQGITKFSSTGEVYNNLPHIKEAYMDIR